MVGTGYETESEAWLCKNQARVGSCAFWIFVAGLAVHCVHTGTSLEILVHCPHGRAGHETENEAWLCKNKARVASSAFWIFVAGLAVHCVSILLRH